MLTRTRSREPKLNTDFETKVFRNPSRNELTRHRWCLPLKFVGEWVVALVLLVLATPVILMAVIMVRLTSRGPAVYRQTRLGRYGRLYTIFKLRTMFHDCEQVSGVIWSPPGDARITPLGRFLRRTHIDELPQLWNVLRGEMSLVGPRPERPEFVPLLEQSLARYRDRLQVRPGITGLAQIQLPPDTDLASVRRKLVYDLFYCTHLSPWLDLKILLCTACKLVGIPFRISGRLLGAPQGPAVEQTQESTMRESAFSEELTSGRASGHGEE